MPYDFEFQESNANHTLSRQETGDAQGVVRGTYTLIDKDGRQRTVTYTADPVNGFQAQVGGRDKNTLSGDLETLTRKLSAFCFIKFRSNRTSQVWCRTSPRAPPTTSSKNPERTTAVKQKQEAHSEHTPTTA